ncbi:MAG: nucleotide sugar dehydrogenase [Actinomycetota bacterium]|nr:MAG: nucleotide sugar [Actinomycetota bacterium]MDO8948920.1 nucleotide sugar dehydrogenase [Actinomycetota bacterium]MDP3630442.1 nucleotide sugar dehydrogenase [Actinomycetota bacterium]
MGLFERIEDGSAVLGVVGLGYVGLPLAVEMAKAGHPVIGLDVSAEKVALINAGTSYIPDVPTEELAELVSRGLIRATTDFSAAAETDAIAICVPTPLDEMKEPDTSFMEKASAAITPYLHADMLITMESTTYPGTTEEVIQPILEASGLKVGETLYLAFSPERVDPGNPTFQTRNTPKVVGGVTAECTRHAVALYSRFINTVVPVSTTRAAEMTKLLENIFRSVNIALMNELLMLCERMDINLWEVVDAAKTKPFGFMPFYPGPGLGGHCIPIDPFYLAWKARQYDFHTEFIELSGKINENMPYYVVTRLMEALNTQRKSLGGSKVMVLGVAYKGDIDDMRESPAIKVAELIMDKGADLVYHDRFIPEFNAGGVSVMRVDLTAETLAAVDAVVVITDHSEVDYALVVENAALILDTRNALKAFSDPKVVRL